MTAVSREDLKEWLDRADAPHVDLGPMLGTDVPVRLGLDDLHALLESGEPSFHLEIGPGSVTVRRQDGGMMAELSLAW